MTTKILLVDDEPEIEGMVKLKMRKRILSGDYSFLFATDGLKALEALDNNPDVDVAALDINMPKMDGLTLLSKIGERHKDVKSIIISAYGDMENIRTAMNLGAYDYLTKPIDFNDFDFTISKTAKLAKEVKHLKKKELEAKEQIYNSLKKEREFNKLKNRFMSMISHEYRTPLTAIQTSAEIIKRMSNGDNKSAKFLATIENSVKTMTNMLDDVLTVGYIEESSEANYSPINLKNVCEIIVSDQRLIDKGEHIFEFSAEGDFSSIKTDESTIMHIFNNLLSNATKYSPPGSKIIFRLKRIDDAIIGVVSDSGIGVPKESIDKIFEPFYRGSNVGKAAGTGLGLAIVKKSVEILGGKIEVDSIEGKGSAFRIILPILK